MVFRISCKGVTKELLSKEPEADFSHYFCRNNKVSNLSLESNEKSFKTPLTGKNIANITKKFVCSV